MIVALALLAAAAGEAAPPPAAAPSMQQRFDEASRLAAANDCLNAIPIFEGLEADPIYRADTLPAAMIAVLKGQCQIKVGRTDEGDLAIRQGLPRLRESGDRFNIDIASALISLGDAALARVDYAGARRRYEEARALPGATAPATINLKLAQATTFDGGPEPLAYAAEAIRQAQVLPGITNDQLAQMHTVHARILLNQGQNQAAYDEMREVLRLSGGLDLRVTLADVAMRGDLALAAKLAGDDANVRKYLAYTGAGRIAESPFERALAMDVPTCGVESGLRPEDFAVVDFAIGEDGRVIRAQTVYTRGPATVASSFAKAVQSWVWDPEALKTIKPFYRFSTRVEVRCTTAGQEVPYLMSPIGSRFRDWATRTLDLAGAMGGADLAARLGALAPSADPAREVARRSMIMFGDAMPTLAEDRQITDVLAIASDRAVPAETRNYLKMRQFFLRTIAKNSRGLGPAGDPAALLAQPEIAADPLALDTLRLFAASRGIRVAGTGQEALLRAVATDPALPDPHPLRQAALLKLADEAAKRRDFATAEANFRATGLTEEQCALLGLAPVMQRHGGEFPEEAYRWGFEGWVSVEFDIARDGRTAQVRPIIAYPPFVFNDGAVNAMQRSRFESSYRPGGGQACSAEQRTVVFRLQRL